MEYLYEHLSMTDKALVDREAVADGLEQLGEQRAVHHPAHACWLDACDSMPRLNVLSQQLLAHETSHMLSTAALPSGYKLTADELERLLDSLDPGNTGGWAALSVSVHATSCGCQPRCAAWGQLATVLTMLQRAPPQSAGPNTLPPARRQGGQEPGGGLPDRLARAAAEPDGALAQVRAPRLHG